MALYCKGIEKLIYHGWYNDRITDIMIAGIMMAVYYHGMIF